MSCKRTARRPPPRLRLAIDSLAFGGDGVGRDPEGRVVFVPGTAPGDEVELRVVEAKKGFARGEVERLLSPSPQRVAPPCPLFRDHDCGGCQWQHVTTAAQRAAKEDVVRRALRHVTTDVRPIATPAPDYHWRRRARLRYRGLRGAPTPISHSLGYLARRSHRLVDVPTCPQLEQPLDAALAAVRATLLPLLEGAGEIELLLGGRGDVHVVVDGRGARALAGAGERLVGQAGIAGVLLREPDSGGAGADVALGASWIDLADDDLPFRARADLFAQVSAPANATLRRLVQEAAAPLAGARVLELFAGSANFTRDLAAAAAHVVAVEDAPPAAAVARENLAARGLAARVTWRAQAAELAVTALAGERFDVVVVDPPRTGFPPGLADALVALAPPRLVYVSCDPNTLARDLGALAAGGLRTSYATPVDLMPQTFHIETVAVASRG